MDENFLKFLEMFKKLQMNIPFIEAIAHMPHYAKFLKEVVFSKKILEEYAIVALIEECSAVIQDKLPHKLKDLGSFTIPSSLGNVGIQNSLCDLGASANLMVSSIFKKLGNGELMSTTISLQLTDHSIKHPLGVMENVLVKVGKFYFLANFYVLEMDDAFKSPLILGRQLLATRGALIDVGKGKLMFRAGVKLKILLSLISQMSF